MVASPSAFEMPARLIIVMGVSGAGKSTIANLLANEISATFVDADDYHPQKNIDKMARGEPLNDRDRQPWLVKFAETMAGQTGDAVGACSSLTKAYRDQITKAAGEKVLFIHLDGSKALIQQRLQLRQDHFMPESLLDSQLKTLEIPTDDELALTVDITPSSTEVVSNILKMLKKPISANIQ